MGHRFVIDFVALLIPFSQPSIIGIFFFLRFGIFLLILKTFFHIKAETLNCDPFTCKIEYILETHSLTKILIYKLQGSFSFLLAWELKEQLSNICIFYHSIYYTGLVTQTPKCV